jgi:hypothetical protein
MMETLGREKELDLYDEEEVDVVQQDRENLHEDYDFEIDDDSDDDGLKNFNETENDILFCV